MSTKKPKVIPFRRKREKKTNYKKRLSLLTSRKLRLVIRKSVNNTLAQLVEYVPSGDKVLFTVKSNALRKIGWENSTSNLPAAYLIGYMLGKKAVDAGIKEAILDLGLHSTKSSRLFACLKGVVDAGLIIPHDEKIIPVEERLKGVHISEKIVKDVETIKKKI